MAAAVLLMIAGMDSAQAQEYPARTVTIIVPFAAGGPADITGRIVADIFNRHLGQKFVVENVGGAGGTIGALRAARAAADGLHDPVRPPGHQCAGVGVLSESRLRSAEGFRADRTDRRISRIACCPQRVPRQ